MRLVSSSFFFFNDTATTEIYTSLHTLSLHDALPIFAGRKSPSYKRRAGEVPEWSIGTVSKTVVRASVPWVRIPPSPPCFALQRHWHASEQTEPAPAGRLSHFCSFPFTAMPPSICGAEAIDGLRPDRIRRQSGCPLGENHAGDEEGFGLGRWRCLGSAVGDGLCAVGRRRCLLQVVEHLGAHGHPGERAKRP